MLRTLCKGGTAAETVSVLVVNTETYGSLMLHLNLEIVGCLNEHTFETDAIRRHGSVTSMEYSHSERIQSSKVSSLLIR